MFSALAVILLSLVAASPVPEADAAAELEARGGNSTPRGWKSYGCHFDCYDGMNRYLPHFAYASEWNSPRKCTQACADAGFKFAGVQFGKECWCGHAVGGQLTSNKDCFIKCPRSQGTCGGPCRNFIYGKK